MKPGQRGGSCELAIGKIGDSDSQYLLVRAVFLKGAAKSHDKAAQVKLAMTMMSLGA